MTRKQLQQELDKLPEDMEVYSLATSGWFMRIERVQTDSLEGMEGSVEIGVLVSNLVE